MQTKFKRLAGILVLAMGGLAAESASSATLIDTTGDAYYENGSGYPYQQLPTGKSSAAQFSTGSFCPTGCYLGNITLRLTTSTLNGVIGNIGNYALSIYTSIDDQPTQIPGLNAPGLGSLVTSSISNPTRDVVYNDTVVDPLYIFTPTVSDILLGDNTSYWAVLTGNTTNPDVSWDFSGNGIRRFNVAAGGDMLGYTGYGHKFKVEATQALEAVPIPGAIWLMGSALVGFVGWGRRLQV